MNLLKCANNHFYDGEKYSTCPHCTVGDGDNNYTMAVEDVQEEPVTMSINEVSKQGNMSLKDALNKAMNSNSNDDDEKTVSILQGGKPGEPVVGWLVCIGGVNFGKSYELRKGKNFIGRSRTMDVVLEGDTSVSRDKHAIVLFEPKKRQFIAQAGESRELFYVNDDVVLTPLLIKHSDVLTIGDTKLMLIPLCGENFCWEDFEKAEKGE